MKATVFRLKKLLLAVLALVLLAALTVPALAVGQSSTLANNGNQYVVNVKGLNVRSGPGMGYSVLGVARKGARMSFIRMEYGWWYVQFSNGKRGWVDKQYVTRVSAKVSGNYSVTASVLNVRNYPRVSATLIGRLRRGTVVSVEKLNGDWAYIAYKGKHGWVATKYLSR